MPQSVWWITAYSLVPSRWLEMISERRASSDARLPALRMTWASPTSGPQELLRVQPGVHAGHDGQVAGGRHGQVALVEALGVGLVGLE